MNKFMGIAKEMAEINNNTKFTQGGPFGAVIVKDGKLIGVGKNNVLLHKNPTDHTEISAIEQACKTLGTHDLSGCELYTSCMPCPMCLSAIIWANIKKVYYGNTKEDAANIGFRDDMIYSTITNIYQNPQDLGNEANKGVLELVNLDRDETITTFEDFKNQEEKTIY